MFLFLIKKLTSSKQKSKNVTKIPNFFSSVNLAIIKLD